LENWSTCPSFSNYSLWKIIQFEPKELKLVCNDNLYHSPEDSETDPKWMSSLLSQVWIKYNMFLTYSHIVTTNWKLQIQYTQIILALEMFFNIDSCEKFWVKTR
jgi:hypothetical protein